MALPSFSARVLLSVLMLSSLLAACSPRSVVVRQLADELAAQSQGGDEDLLLLRDAAPFHLKLSESVLRQQPGHVPLATAVASGFTQYAYAFVAFEADRLEARDATAAAQLRQRAARLYLRASRHARTALASSHADLDSQRLTQRLSGSAIDPGPDLSAEQVALAYWGAASWGAAIALSKDDPDIVADLPQAIRLAEWAARNDAQWGNGALMSLRGSFEAARPGGSAQRASALFDQAIALAAGQQAGPYVAKAESIALPAGDKAAFVALLNTALAVSEPADSPLRLHNEVMRQRAAWLLHTTDDLF